MIEHLGIAEELQWSLASMSEEGLVALEARNVLVRASMEPRFNERGRVAHNQLGKTFGVSFNGASLQ